MNIRFSVCMITGAIITIASLSPRAKAVTTIDVEDLARKDASLTYCERIDPAKTTLYQRGMKTLISGHSEGEIERDRESKDYLQTRQEFDTLLNHVNRAAAFLACRDYLAGK